MIENIRVLTEMAIELLFSEIEVSSIIKVINPYNKQNLLAVKIKNNS